MATPTTSPFREVPTQPIHCGKVRDTYENGDADNNLLVVATDRISIRDVVLNQLVPGKGIILTRLTEFWLTSGVLDVQRHHLVSTDINDVNPLLRAAIPDLEDRFMVVQRCEMFPLEGIVRGYLYGSIMDQYRRTGSIGEVQLPAGLAAGSRLRYSVFTPSSKAPLGEHDVNLSHHQARAAITAALMDAGLYPTLREESRYLYEQAAQYAASVGLILADTKFEWGINPQGAITLCDEVLTPDSSRFWDQAYYDHNGTIIQLDKQGVRDYYKREHPEWDETAPAPDLPDLAIWDVQQAYNNLLQRLTGEKMSF